MTTATLEPPADISGDVPGDDLADIELLRSLHHRLVTELSQVVLGQTAVIEQLMWALLCRGHTLISGVPGLAKTLIVKSMAAALTLRHQRIQFTPDLLPADILGAEVIRTEPDGRRQIQFVPGPLFANLVLADEINRTPPRTQAALIEAMQEGRVTVGGESRSLPVPFLVLATQNPIEQEGTYPLPLAQRDRFMLAVQIDYPSAAAELEVARRTSAVALPAVAPVLSSARLIALQDLVRRVPVPPAACALALRLVRATRPQEPSAPVFVREWLEWGAGPRAAQQLLWAARARAALAGEPFARTTDVRAVALPVLRHRLILNFAAVSSGVSTDQIITRLLAEAGS